MTNITNLDFEFADKAKWKKGRFEIENLLVTGEGEGIDISFDTVKLFLDGKLYKGGIDTWAIANVSTDYLFSSILNSYLRDNAAEYKSFGDEWSVFDKIKDLTVKENGLVTELPVFDYRLKVYKLELATPESRYYTYYDEFMLLDKYGEIVTDIEPFYHSGLCQDVCGILTGKIECLYKDHNIDLLVKEYGGEKEFIEAFETHDPEL